MLNNTSAFSDFYYETMLPELKIVIMDKYKSQKDLIPMLFNVNSTKNGIEQASQVTGFPVAPEINQGEDVSYYQFKQGFDKTFRMVKYGLGFKITEEMYDDQKFPLIGRLARLLAKSIFEVRQRRAFNVFNNGFSDTGPDGVSLFNASHQNVGGGTQSNTASTDLTVGSLQAAITVAENYTDDEGLHQVVTMRKLLVPNELKFKAKEILNSSSIPYSADNEINALQDENLMLYSTPYLTDQGQWILLAEKDETELQFWERKAPTHTSSFDFDSDNAKEKMKTRFDVGYAHWMGTYSAT